VKQGPSLIILVQIYGFKYLYIIIKKQKFKRRGGP
jgi:hypothetical protein